VVVSVASAEDISVAVKFAGECGLKVSIKGGGHSWCGTSMRDGALALDLGGLKGLTVDRASVSERIAQEKRCNRLTL
jgi:FAD/FMN-containing dehydrogenase